MRSRQTSDEAAAVAAQNAESHRRLQSKQTPDEAAAAAVAQNAESHRRLRSRQTPDINIIIYNNKI